MPKKLMCVMAALFCLVAGLSAQTVGTGNLTGTVVTADDGSVIPGVSVIIKSPAMIVESQVSVSNERGTFRFNNLNPGEYEVTFQLEGMGTVVRRGIRVSAGQVITLNVPMSFASVKELVEISGQTPTIDVQKTTKAANLSSDFIKSMPAVRDINTFFNMIPGVTGGTSHGSSYMDNSFSLDGVNIGDASTGTQSGVRFSMDITEELAVQTGGITAEHGNVRGSMVNVVTKSGGNSFSGSASFYLNHEDLKSDNTKGTLLEGSKSGSKLEIEPVLTMGGPIVKNKLWFFATLSFNQDESFVAGYPAGSKLGEEIPVKFFRPMPYLKLSFQPSASNTMVLSYNYADNRTDHRGASKFATESVTQIQSRPTHSITGNWNYAFSPELLTNFRFGMSIDRFSIDAKGDSAQFVEHFSGVASGNAWRNQDRNVRDRYQFNADATLFIDDFLGTHEWKAGMEYSVSPSAWKVYGVADPVTGGSYNYMLGDSYYYTLILLNGGFDRKDTVSMLHGFIQDQWSLTRNISLNIGLRFENNRVVYPAQNADEGPIVFNNRTYNRGIPEKLTMYDWLNLAPRAGLSWDLFSDGKTVFKTSWSRYILPNQLGFVNTAHPNGWFGVIQYLNPDGSHIPGNFSPWVLPGGFANPGGNEIGYKDYKLKAGYTDEFTIGIERELLEDISMGIRYIKKWDRNSPYQVDSEQLDIDKLLATGELDWSKNWVERSTVDPYTGQAVTFFSQINRTLTKKYVVNPPGANRDYDGIEVTFDKRFSKGWGINASYIWAHSRGLITTTRNDESLGGAASGFFASPNAHINAEGRFPLERRHQVKLNAIGRGPLGFNLSGYFRYMSGTTYTRTISSINLGLPLTQGNTTIMAEKRGTNNLPDLVLLDLRLEKEFRIGPTIFSVFADCFNVFNTAFATGVWTNSSNQTVNKYGDMTSINTPRIFQLGAKFQF